MGRAETDCMGGRATEGMGARWRGDVVMLALRSGAVAVRLRLALRSMPGSAERRASGAVQRGCHWTGAYAAAGAAPTGLGRPGSGGMALSRVFKASGTGESGTGREAGGGLGDGARRCDGGELGRFFGLGDSARDEACFCAGTGETARIDACFCAGVGESARSGMLAVRAVRGALITRVAREGQRTQPAGGRLRRDEAMWAAR